MPRVDIAHLLRAAPGAPGRQDPLERLAELGVEDRVDDRIEGRVGVAQPGQHLERLRPDAGLAERGDDIYTEERHPADQEHAHDDPDGDGRLVVRDVVRRGRVVRQLPQFQLVLARLGPPYAAVALLADLARPRHRSYRFDVLLGVAVESGGRKRKGKKRNGYWTIDSK